MLLISQIAVKAWMIENRLKKIHNDISKLNFTEFIDFVDFIDFIDFIEFIDFLL